MALWLRLALLSSGWNWSGFGKQGPSSATGQTSLRSRRGAILRDLGATTAGWCAGSAPAPESSVTFEAAQGLSGIGRQPEEPMYDTESKRRSLSICNVFELCSSIRPSRAERCSEKRPPLFPPRSEPLLAHLPALVHSFGTKEC